MCTLTCQHVQLFIVVWGKVGKHALPKEGREGREIVFAACQHKPRIKPGTCMRGQSLQLYTIVIATANKLSVAIDRLRM